MSGIFKFTHIWGHYHIPNHVLTGIKLHDIEEARFITEHVKGGRLLDAGTGNGNMLFHILNLRKDVIPFAMDISEELLFRLKQRAARSRPAKFI